MSVDGFQSVYELCDVGVVTMPGGVGLLDGQHRMCVQVSRCCCARPASSDRPITTRDRMPIWALLGETRCQQVLVTATR